MDNLEYYNFLFNIQKVYINYKEIITQINEIIMSQIKQYNILQLKLKLK